MITADHPTSKITHIHATLTFVNLGIYRLPKDITTEVLLPIFILHLTLMNATQDSTRHIIPAIIILIS
jgi:hypothetical protein